jgi:hypothetical protein
MQCHRYQQGAFVGVLGLGVLAASLGLASPAAPAQNVPPGPPAVFGSPCAPGVRDQANPAQCLEASSVAELGSLYPLSQDFFIDSATGNVGLGTLAPVVPLTVLGTIGMGNELGQPRASIRPSQNGVFGVFEAFTGQFSLRTVLISTSAISPNSGAMATQWNGGFLTLVTTPANDANSGYMSVLTANSETAGMNGATGTVFGAQKLFVQPHPSDAQKEIQYVSLEGPENGVYYRGSERLVGGEAVLTVPESFRLVARSEGLTVNLTPLGPSAGLYVAEKGLERIVVRENPGGTGDASFDFLVMGVRSALPEHVAITDNVHFAPKPGTTVEPGRMPGAYRELMIQNGTLGPDGAVSLEQALELGWRQESGLWKGGPAGGALPADADVVPAPPRRERR